MPDLFSKTRNYKTKIQLRTNEIKEDREIKSFLFTNKFRDHHAYPFFQLTTKHP